jgi:hypothetical protein
MFHGGSFFKKRPPWPPEAKKTCKKDQNRVFINPGVANDKKKKQFGFGVDIRF